jgi:hypothetical protein
MNQTWLTSRIVLNRWEDKPEVIRRAIAPLVRECESFPWFKTFHFLSYGNEEEGIYLRFRVALDADKRNYMREVIEKKIQEVNAKVPIVSSVDYDESFLENPEILKQEEQRFGKVGLSIFLKYFEYVSRTVVGLLERPEAEMETYPIKYRMTTELFHFLLNPLLYYSFDGDGEISAHVNAIMERYLTLVSILMSQGKSKELAVESITQSRPWIDSERTLKLTISIEKVGARASSKESV